MATEEERLSSCKHESKDGPPLERADFSYSILISHCQLRFVLYAILEFLSKQKYRKLSSEKHSLTQVWWI